MAIEQTDYLARYVYRIDPHDAQQIQRKANKPRATWSDYLRYDDAHTAKAKLLRLGRDYELEAQR